MGLPCAHSIYERKHMQNGNALLLTDVDSHWYLENVELQVLPAEPLLDPQVARPRGRPSGSRNRERSASTRRTSRSENRASAGVRSRSQNREPESSTRWDPSAFERIIGRSSLRSNVRRPAVVLPVRTQAQEQAILEALSDNEGQSAEDPERAGEDGEEDEGGISFSYYFYVH
ncbi:MAG: hypothetical protein M1829_000651 [Trizodia sp. TS-e1964]|nr:MAG: hypothetical protein M1829_000651 [Trizodia sp. TS-e1964]